MDKLNILVSVNSKFIKPLKVLLYSLYKTQSTPCVIYLINISLSKEEIEEIHSLCNILNFEFNVLTIPNKAISCINEKQKELSELNLSIETYSRLFIPNLLSDVDRILWLDADCLVKKDLHDFYYQDLKDKVVAACDHCNWRIPSIPEFSYWDYPIRKQTPEYFNAGVILFDLSKCRRIRGFQIDNMISLIKFMDCRFFDQDILNTLIGKDRVLWCNTLLYNTCVNQNWASSFNNHPIQYSIYENSYILHYCSPDKPWNLSNNMTWGSRKYWIKTYMELNDLLFKEQIQTESKGLIYKTV